MRSADANYRWWKSNGASWREQVEQRKRRMPIYHIQELLLSDYLRRCAPCRILEFGCGYGRHLEYLNRIPGLEVFGYDQSRSIIENADWEGPAWREEHLLVGPELGPLPFEDKSFDVVLTVSALIHVRPEHLDGILAELVRVARRQIFHVENNETSEPHSTSEAHGGCWAHDLLGAYRDLGCSAQVLPKCFELEDVFRVVLDEDRAPPEIDPLQADKLLSLDRSLSAGVAELSREVERERRARAATERRSVSNHERIRQLETECEALRTRAREAEAGQAGALDRTRVATLECEALRTRAREAEARQAEALDRTRVATLECEALRTRAREAEARQAEALDRTRVATLECEALRTRAREAEARQAEALDRTRVATLECEALRTRAREAEARQAEALDRTRVATLECEALRTRAREAEARQAELLERVRALTAKCETLRARARDAEARHAWMRERFQTSERGAVTAPQAMEGREVSMKPEKV